MKTPLKQFGWLERLAVGASSLLLIGAGWDSTHFRPAPDSKEYHNRVQKVAQQLVPNTVKFGDWNGVEQPVDYSAVTILHPNVMVSRGFRNAMTGLSVGFLFVDCEDARDTIGHYPPICYPSQGWTVEGKEPKDWELPHMTIHGMEYTFVRSVFDGSGTLVVDDFFVLPGAGTNPDRDQVIQAAGDLQRRFYGVAQVQLVFPTESNAQQRDQAVVDLLSPMEDLITAVQTIKPVQESARGAINPPVPEYGKGDMQ
jgi:hypothetical protein